MYLTGDDLTAYAPSRYELTAGRSNYIERYDVMSLDDAFKEIILYKAERMKSGLVPRTKYNRHIKRVLGQDGAIVSEEQVQNFVMGGIDAMIYDVASLVGFTRNTAEYSDWASCRKRQEVLREIFPAQDRKEKHA